MKTKPRSPGHVVEEFDVEKEGKNHHIVFRYPKIDDVDEALEYVNALVDEAEYIRINKKMTKEEEERWLKGAIEKIARSEAVTLFVFVDGKMTGSSSSRTPGGSQSHVSDIGISLREKCTGMGIGSRLMKALESESKRLGIEILRLTCYACNARAKHVYQKSGYKEAGFIPNARKNRGKYDGEVIMYKEIGHGG